MVAWQIGREPRAFRRAAVRCPWGLPAVTEQAPYDDAGDPFPTTYYLTCRRLVAAVARVEAAAGVERWAAAVQENPELKASLEGATARQREIRRTLAAGVRGRDGGASLDLGIGGAARTEHLKCLHAHVAFALVHPEYELGRRILAELSPLWADDHCCSVDRGATD